MCIRDSSGTGCFVHADDIEAIARAIQLLAINPQGFKSLYFKPRPEVIARYERQALTQRLATVFDELIPL